MTETGVPAVAVGGGADGEMIDLGRGHADRGETGDVRADIGGDQGLRSGLGQRGHEVADAAGQDVVERQARLRIRVAAAETDGAGVTAGGIVERIERRHREGERVACRAP